MIRVEGSTLQGKREGQNKQGSKSVRKHVDVLMDWNGAECLEDVSCKLIQSS